MQQNLTEHQLFPQLSPSNVKCFLVLLSVLTEKHKIFSVEVLGPTRCPNGKRSDPEQSSWRSHCFARKGDNKAKSSSQIDPFPKHLQVVIAGRRFCITSIDKPARKRVFRSDESLCLSESSSSSRVSEEDDESSASRPSTGRSARNGCGRWRSGWVGGWLGGGGEMMNIPAPGRNARNAGSVR